MGDIGGVAQAGASLAGAGIQAAASKSAANTAADASKYASTQQYNAAQNALNQQKSLFNTGQSNISPYLQSGSTALKQLNQGTAPGGQFETKAYSPFQATGAAASALNPAQFQATGLAQNAVNPSQFQATGLAQNALNPSQFQATGRAANALNEGQFQATGLAQNALNPAQFSATGMAQNALNPTAFQAPTAAEAAATPGYQFQFDQGLNALQRSQAATGITGGGAAKAAEQYGQGLASTNYQQAYNDALGTYGTNLNTAQGALANQSGTIQYKSGAGPNCAREPAGTI